MFVLQRPEPDWSWDCVRPLIGPVCDWRWTTGRYAGISCQNISFWASPRREGQRPACVSMAALSGPSGSLMGGRPGSLSTTTSTQPLSNRPADALSAISVVTVAVCRAAVSGLETGRTDEETPAGRSAGEFLRLSRWHLQKTAAKMFPLQENIRYQCGRSFTFLYLSQLFIDFRDKIVPFTKIFLRRIIFCYMYTLEIKIKEQFMNTWFFRK